MEKDNDIEINLAEIISVLLRKAWLIILVGLIFAMLAVFGTHLFVTPKFQSTTKIYVLSKQSQESVTSNDLQVSTLLMQDYIQVIKSRTVMESVISRLNLDMKYEELLHKIDVSSTSETRIIEITAIDDDPYRARDIADTVSEISTEHIKNVMNSEAVNVVDKANVPDTEFTSPTKKYAVIAGLMGCMIVILIIVIRCLLDDTIKSSEDVEKYLGLSTLAMIPATKQENETKKAGKTWRKIKFD